MLADDRPSLRPYLEAVRESSTSQTILVHDRLRLSNAFLRLTPLQLRWLELFDGSRSIRDIQIQGMRLVGGQFVPLDFFLDMARQLDEALFLDTPRFRARINAPVRPPVCIGAYEGQPDALRQQLRDLFLHPQGAGLPGPFRDNGRLRAILAPHIDFARGGPCYTHAFKELFERSPAALFVIIGTSHYSPQRFTLTRKHFQTPLGTVPTDQSFIDKVVSVYGEGLFEDEWGAHLPEHSIELEVVFLQYLYENQREIRIVPLLVGSFHDCVRSGQSPATRPEIARMVAALRSAEKETAEPVCYIISGDLAHIGPKFDDPQPVTLQQLEHSQRRDQRILSRLTAATGPDPELYFEEIAAEQDERRICGLPPTWLTLQVAQPKQARQVAYRQYAHPQGVESVSFASAVFEGE